MILVLSHLCFTCVLKSHSSEFVCHNSEGKGCFHELLPAVHLQCGGGGSRECPDGFKCQKVQVNCLEGAGTCSSSILCSKG